MRRLYHSCARTAMARNFWTGEPRCVQLLDWADGDGVQLLNGQMAMAYNF